MPANVYYLTPKGAEEPLRFEIERLDEHRVEVTRHDGSKQIYDVRAFGHLLNLLTDDNHSVEVHAAVTDKDEVLVTTDNLDATFSVLNERKYRMAQVAGGSSGAGGPDLVSPMAGKVVLLKAAEGDTVEQGDVVVIIEAMKMENDLKAHISGTISSISVSPGDIVDIGQTLLSIEAAE